MNSFKKKIAAISLLPVSFLLLCSCTRLQTKPVSATALKLNTIVSVTIYDDVPSSLAEDALAVCDQYDVLFSRTNPDSEIYQLNHGMLDTDVDGYSTISTQTYDIIALGLSYSKVSHNTFDIAIEPLSSLWDFSSGESIIPTDADITASLSHLSPDQICLKAPDKIKFKDFDAGIDLGGISKGYIADKMADYLKTNGVENAIINLGGNVLCMGNKENQPFTIGIQKPFAPQNEYLATIQITDKSVVSSGIYERYFEKDNHFYHHILNPATGYPYENDLIGVTIISNSSTDADALSTTCFSLGLDEGLKLIAQIENADALFIDSDYNLHFSEGFKEKYHLVLSD